MREAHMIAELAAANAAFDVIKQTIQNGQEIYAAGEALAQYFGLKSEIQRKAHEHGYKSDLAAFMASEQLAAQEKELKDLMIYSGRGGMWEDWLNFQSQMKRSREEERLAEIKARHKRKKAMVDTILIGATAVAVLISIGLIIFIFMQISR
jgi:hypothetical protein